ncbi:hypothetical protein VD0002_g9111 [Verticillium dahliae]|nr:hypothetical protein VD0003_g6483 [Verticillium dahliae]PNH58415.1 hypothetical protein VD0002_g9111 [Verticillium dahliae]
MICTLIVADSDRARHQAPALEAQASRLAPRPHKSSGKTSKGPQSPHQSQPVPSVSRRSFIRAPARAFRDEEARGSRRFARPNGGDLSRTPNVGRDPGTRLHRMDRAGEVAQQQTGKREDRGCGERESDGGGGGDGGFAAAFSSASRPTAVDLAR